MAEKKFCDMDSVERFEDLRDRKRAFDRLELPGQPRAMHMGTSYLVNDLWRELQRYRAAPVLVTKGVMAGEELAVDTRVPLSMLSPTALVTMPLVAELEQRIVALERRGYGGEEKGDG